MLWGWNGTEVWVSTGSWPWRRKFSFQDSNLWPFSHESGALTTELSPLFLQVQCFCSGTHNLANLCSAYLTCSQCSQPKSGFSVPFPACTWGSVYLFQHAHRVQCAYFSMHRTFRVWVECTCSGTHTALADGTGCSHNSVRHHCHCSKWCNVFRCDCSKWS